jgi:hypothetical protein
MEPAAVYQRTQAAADPDPDEHGGQQDERVEDLVATAGCDAARGEERAERRAHARAAMIVCSSATGGPPTDEAVPKMFGHGSRDE